MLGRTCACRRSGPDWHPLDALPAGELRAGAWGFSADLAPGVLGLLSLPPDQLWQALADSPHLARVQ